MRRVKVGDPVRVEIPFSEAAVDYGIAGERHWVRLTEGGRAAQVALGPDNWAGIFTPGELGVRVDRDGYYADELGVRP